MKITHAFFDCDSIPYVGANIAEKPVYQWFHKDGLQQSKTFSKAALAKEWMESEVGFNEGDPDDWERKTVMDLQGFDVCVKGIGYELTNWIKSVKRLTGNDDIIIKGMLTCSGQKNNDLGHLQDRYQHNRYESRTPKNLPEGHDKYTAPWVGLRKPTHLKEARTYFMTTNDWCSMSPAKVEADAPIVYFAERRGYSAVVCSKDKDLKQVMGSHFIDMNAKEKDRILILSDVIGHVELVYNARGKAKLVGNGFKLIMAQTIMGDASDGYKGIKGVADVAAFELLGDCETVDECCKVIFALYLKKFADGLEYVDWQGNKQFKTAEELAIQHCDLAYHERGSKDTKNPMSRFLDGEYPVYDHNGKLGNA